MSKRLYTYTSKAQQKRKLLMKYLSPALTEYALKHYSKRLVHRLAKGELLSKILKEKYFWNGRFMSTNNTLDPRPETELIVELFIKYFTPYSIENRKFTLLDACAGTGAIGISIMEEIKLVHCTFLDISHKALQICKKNIRLHKLWHRSKIYKTALESIDQNKTYDFLVSNPPYLTGEEINNNLPILSQEPRIAFYGGEDGLHFYRILANYIKTHIKNFALIEMDHDRSEQIYNIFNFQKFTELEMYRDCYGLYRVLYIKI